MVNPATLIGELDMLTARGIDTAKVRVSRNAHVIMPYHVALDRAMETRLDGEKVGTTNRGIGPTYADRASRLGLRMEDLLDEPTFRHRLAKVLPDKNTLLGDDAGDDAVRGRAAGRPGDGLGRAPATAPRRHDLARPGRARAAATTSSSRAPRARSSTSTTAATRT